MKYFNVANAGLLIALLLWLLPILFLISLFQQADAINLGGFLKDAYFWHVIKFSIQQALLSALLSVVPAVFIALSLYRCDFLGKAAFLRLCSAIFVLPSLVIVVAVISFYGKGGWLASIFHFFSWDYQPKLYGLPYIVIAHVLFNLPLAVKFFYDALCHIPSTQHKLAAQLNMSAFHEFCYVQWFYIRRQFLSVFMLIFVICFSSFAIVQTLGGGPKYTSLEVFIYQSIRDFDLAQAALLAIIQIALCFCFALLLQLFQHAFPINQSLDINWRRKSDTGILRFSDYGVIILALFFLLLPLLTIVFSGINARFIQVLQQALFWSALMHSMIIASITSVFAVLMVYLLCRASHSFSKGGQVLCARFIKLSGRLIITIPTMVLGIGCYVFFYRSGLPQSAYLIMIFVNTLMALPYLLAILEPFIFDNQNRQEKIAKTLVFTRWQSIYWLQWRALRKPLRQGLALAALISIGDYGVISIFGSHDFQTLPAYLAERLGSYRVAEGQATALIMLLIYAGIFWFFERSAHD